jgi:hypothetical protein
MTDKEKKPPVWAYADEWDNMSDVERAVRLSYLCGVQARLEGRTHYPRRSGTSSSTRRSFGNLA